MRFFGLGAKVMQKLGVSTQLMAPADIFPALERGVIDAAELSFPSMDFNLLARFYVVEAITTRQDGNRFRLDLNWKF
jgi:TRAP-type mannitol/chloroaromatic compound transport system substrate-binding protein